jgi:hypothetical protein
VRPVDFVKSFPSELAALDADEDSVLSIEEDGLHADIAAADLAANGGNGDGIVTREELFERYDSNRNGVLETASEADSLTDFIRSLDADRDGSIFPSGYRVNTGPGGEPVVLDFTGFVIQVQLGGEIKYKENFRLNGVILFQVDAEGLKLFVNAGLSIGSAENKYFDLHALGVLIINKEGLATDLEVTLKIGQDLSKSLDSSGLDIRARLLMNTSGKEQSVDIPDEFLDSLSDTALARLKTASGDAVDADGSGKVSKEELDTARNAPGLLKYTVPGAAPSLASLFSNSGTVNEPALSDNGFYVAIAFEATLRFGGSFDLSGRFGVLVTGDKFELLIAARLTIGKLGDVGASGSLRISKEGLVGRIQLTLAIDALGLKINGDALFEINTTGKIQSLNAFDFKAGGGLELKTVNINPGVLVWIKGEIVFVEVLKANAEVKITYRSDLKTFRMEGTASIEVAVFGKLDIAIGLQIQEDGIALAAAMSVDVKFAEIIKLKASGHLYINTTNGTITLNGRDIAR